MILTIEQLRNTVTEEVYEELAEWGTTAYVTHPDGTRESLRILLNKLCDPLVSKICKRLILESEENA